MVSKTKIPRAEISIGKEYQIKSMLLNVLYSEEDGANLLFDGNFIVNIDSLIKDSKLTRDIFINTLKTLAFETFIVQCSVTDILSDEDVIVANCLAMKVDNETYDNNHQYDYEH